jgi:hypothetical protein
MRLIKTLCVPRFIFSADLIRGTLQEILNLYGEWLFERREFAQSALGMQAITSPPT